MTNQSNYKNNQNFKIDINEFYNSVVSEIDEIRGYVNISSPDNLKKLNLLKVSDFGGVTNKLQVSDSYQESRAHAFLRLVGFPVVGTGNDFYNPGHDGVKYLFDNIFTTKTRKISKKLEIINSPRSGYYDFSVKRESYYNSKVQEWFGYQNIITSSFILSSYNIRNFNDHVDKYQEIFDFDIDNQSYLVKLADPLNRSLLEYSTNNIKLTAKRYHYIFPLIVDPRLDLAAIKKPAVPFTWKQSQLQINPTITAKIPLLQKVIESRYLAANRQGEVGAYAQDIIDFVSANDEIKDDEIISKIQDPTSYGIVERQMFLKFLNLISSMVDELISAQNDIDLVYGITWYLPICGTKGIESGIRSYDIGLFENKYNSELDNEIQRFRIKDTLNKITPQTSKVQNEGISKSITDFIAPGIDIITKAFGDISRSTYQSLIRTKLSFDTKASEAFKNIELIMGEFSGLGLCDIVAILAGLYLVERRYLLGLLDDDAYDRCIKILKLSGEPRPTLEESLAEIQKNVFQVYNIMQTIYTERKQFGIRI